MGRQVDNITFDYVCDNKILDSCITLNFNTERHYTDEYEVPYKYTVLTNTRKNEVLPDNIEISNVKELFNNIEEKNCLPDVGLLDYKDEELGLNLKNITLRELYKEVLKKIL
ncbi:hypothetical protein [Clostridium chauvoei]|uniref:Uncharacterized protein n=2 Tax=Clostridium chauvoei TaxID=46867 RepID=S6EKC1_9CLOT|nr:hypothetical protein [Clostridium chauvoei]ATD55028.1 hypothetical protein BTM20_07160 [Clostridium chauvoei]ATD57296.1 hypothetical protein BTM21_05895 [Clostridium chauvoei]MBX7279368.1 hypothetical protein [Clostridium chauvoei]MBX7283860.1 hypothetical protein [Clostridium chauvoei]MBX7285566.1 hypothetical protein [Clostridium chauvoei]